MDREHERHLPSGPMVTGAVVVEDRVSADAGAMTAPESLRHVTADDIGDGDAQERYELASGLSRRTYNVARLAASFAAGPSPAAQVCEALDRGLPAEDVASVLVAIA